MRFPLSALILAPLFGQAAAAPQESGAVAAQFQVKRMPSLVQRFTQDKRDLERFYDDVDSSARGERLLALATAWRARLDRIPAGSLERSGWVDWHALSNALDRLQHREQRARELREHLAPLLPFREAILELEDVRRRVLPMEPAELASRLSELGTELQVLESQVRERLGEGSADPIDATTAKRAGEATARMAGLLASTCRHYSEFRPDFDWWVKRPQEQLLKDLRAYAKLLREEGAGLMGTPDDPLVGEPLGSAALARELQLELLSQSPAQLAALAEEDLAWCEVQLREAAEELGFSDPKDALEHVRNLGAEPGLQDQLVAEQARQAIRFLDERDLVTIEPLARETFVFDMLSTERQRSLPFAAYGGQRMLVAYPTREMDQDTKLMALRGNNEHFSRIVTPHELIPGHHLQGYMAQRYATHRQAFRTPFLTEGWALYWEMLLWDDGWARGPEDRIGMLFWRMHRGARVLVMLGFHSNEMTPEDMVQFLVERIGHEPYTARAEVRRYVGDAYGPIYPIGYLIGGLQLRALGQELVGPEGMQPKAYHDAILHEGPIPVALMRAALGSAPLDKDSRPAEWDFEVKR